MTRTDDYGIGLLIKEQRIKRVVSSYVGENHLLFEQYQQGRVEVELVPQAIIFRPDTFREL